MPTKTDTHAEDVRPEDLGDALQQKGLYDQAIACYEAALRDQPDDPVVRLNMGNAYLRRNHLDNAVAQYRRSIELKPDYAEAFHNLGSALQLLGSVAEAVRCYQQALKLRPDYAEAHKNMANALRTLGRPDAAEKATHKALRQDPTYADAHINHGNALLAQGRVGEAIARFRQTIDLVPNHAEAHSNMLLAMNYLPDLAAKTLFDEHVAWAQEHTAALPVARQYTNTCDPDRPLRIGYISPDLREHPVTRFMESILAHHDQSAVQHVCYAQVTAEDDVSARLRACGGQWRNIAGRSTREIAVQIVKDKIDILVDLAGHTANNKLMVMAHKPAPIGVTYLGYPNTTGMARIDYRLTDAVADPESPKDAATPHVETLARLPHHLGAYTPAPDAPPVTKLPALPSEKITFGCTNHLAKINAQVIDLWAKLLERVPTARLLVYRDNLVGVTQQILKVEMNQRNIDLERVVLTSTLPMKKSRLQVYEYIDVALDPFPWNGHTTTCESLWQGVPVVALRGRTQASRLAASVLTHAGLEHLVADTSDDYVRIAADLVCDLDQLAETRASLRERFGASPVCDAPGFTAALEAEYRRMWDRWCKSQV
jgi:protein O-GlcNAc transferase